MSIASDTPVLDDQERLRLAEQKYSELAPRREGLSDGELAEWINQETGVGSDAARLVVMGHSSTR